MSAHVLFDGAGRGIGEYFVRSRVSTVTPWRRDACFGPLELKRRCPATVDSGGCYLGQFCRRAGRRMGAPTFVYKDPCELPCHFRSGRRAVVF